MRIRYWCIATVLFVAAFVCTQIWINSEPRERKRVTLEKPTLKKATKTPGRIVELHTSKGQIDFVLFEEDCPKTTKRIVDLVQKGSYNGVKFPRVEEWIIQTSEAKEKVEPMELEAADGLSNVKGAVGIARQLNDANSNRSTFYILLDPQTGLDSQFTVFGRVINGMDVAMKIEKDDVIKSAKVRPLTNEDKKKFNEILTIAAERKTQ